MREPAGELDWDEAERRERRRELWGLPGIAAFFVGVDLVTGHVGFWTGGAAWAWVGLLLAFLLLMTAASRLTPRLRAGSAGSYRIRTALSHHIDPGPEWRVRTDRAARYWAGVSWIGWIAPIGPIVFLLDGQWDRPVAAAAGTVLLVGAVSAWILWWRSQVRAARRWLADPPGPSRAALRPTTAERWLTGGRGLAIVIGLALLLGLVGGLAIAFAGRS